jgi:hypothetical protein
LAATVLASAGSCPRHAGHHAGDKCGRMQGEAVMRRTPSSLALSR